MKSKQMLWGLLSIVLPLFAGCELLLIGGGVAAGAATVAYINGELKTRENASLNQVYAASQQALEELEFPIEEQAKDAVSANLQARTSADKPVKIQLSRISPDMTEIRIRSGIFGDESMSRMVYEKIEGNLY